MKRSECMTLGEFQELTKDMPDRTCLMVTSHIVNDEALALIQHPFCTTLDHQDVFLFDAKVDDSVHFEDC